MSDDDLKARFKKLEREHTKIWFALFVVVLWLAVVASTAYSAFDVANCAGRTTYQASFEHCAGQRND